MIENLIPYDYSRTKSSICAALQKPEQLTVSNLWRLEDYFFRGGTKCDLLFC